MVSIDVHVIAQEFKADGFDLQPIIPASGIVVALQKGQGVSLHHLPGEWSPTCDPRGVPGGQVKNVPLIPSLDKRYEAEGGEVMTRVRTQDPLIKRPTESAGFIEQSLHLVDNHHRKLDTQWSGYTIEQLQTPGPRFAVGSTQRNRLGSGRAC